LVDQVIEAPTEADIDRVARQLLHADSVVKEIVGRALDGSRDDLTTIQSVLDAGAIDRAATYTLQALGLAFGKVLIEQNSGFDWWMVEDEFGRDPAIRFKQTPLLAFPMTMISKRLEAGEQVDVETLFDELEQRLLELARDQTDH
jgi:hypothetical protein